MTSALVAACTKIWDQIALRAWQDHGVILFHFQDGRVPAEIRETLSHKWSKKYGGRA